MADPQFHECEQRSPEWFAARRGVITGTGASKLFGMTKTGRYTAQREAHIASLAMERLNTEAIYRPSGAEQRRGAEREADALVEYSFTRRVEVESVGFVTRGRRGLWGASPDGLVGQGGGVEVKVPSNAAKHAEYLDNPSSLVREYGWQPWHCLFVTDRDWWDLASYLPEAPNRLCLAMVRIYRPATWRPYINLLVSADRDVATMQARLEATRLAA